MNWTIVHEINQESPLFKTNLEELKKHLGEVLILIKGFDDTFSQVVHSRFSYCAAEIIEGKTFDRIYEIDENGNILVDIDKIHSYS